MNKTAVKMLLKMFLPMIIKTISETVFTEEHLISAKNQLMIIVAKITGWIPSEVDDALIARIGEEIEDNWDVTAGYIDKLIDPLEVFIDSDYFMWDDYLKPLIVSFREFANIPDND